MDDNALLTYFRFQIWPNQNRYQALASDGKKEEIIFDGLLEQLTQHLPQVKDFYSGGSEANIKLQRPRTSSAASWFSESTFRRFLNIANSMDFSNKLKAVEDEMSQLEKARKFHLSLYSQSESEVNAESSDSSKNELLRAIDSRLKALREELTAALEQAAGSFCGSQQISFVVQCCQNLAAWGLKKILIKYSEMSHMKLILDYSCEEELAFVAVGCDDERPINKTISNFAQSVGTVKCDVSPAKVAQAERESETDSEDSSDDCDVDTAERSRSVARSATPRRSASPMRRVQIARMGSRRATAIGIKSLNYFPAREKTLHDSDEECSEKPPRKPEINVQRMSVQDAISLFESKQREEKGDIQKKSLGDMPKSEKPVLRKWSSCIDQSYAQCSTEAGSENPNSSSEANPWATDILEVDRREPEKGSLDPSSHQSAEADLLPHTSDNLESSVADTHGDTAATQVEESTQRLTASVKWNQQKEAELNMLMKMIESKPVKSRKPITNKGNTPEQRGGFYDEYKKKRDEKLRGENAGKRAEKEAQFKAMQQIIEKSKADMPSKDRRRQSLRKSLPSATPPQSVNPKKESPVNSKKESPDDNKPAIVKRGTQKSSSVPATRKSWPSSPTPQTTGISPVAKSSNGVASSTGQAARRKSQPSASTTRSNLKAEKPIQPKTVMGLQTESNKGSKGTKVIRREPTKGDAKPTKPKSLVSSEDFSDMVLTKASMPSKGAKRSSVVPVEVKPFLRRGSKVGSAVVPAPTKSKASPQSKESVRKSGNKPCSEEKEVAVQSPEQVNKHETENPVQAHADAAFDVDTLEIVDQKSMDPATPVKNNTSASMNLTVAGGTTLKFEKEETAISPSAWVEVEENQEPSMLPIPIDDSEVQFAYATSVASTEITSPRMRQSLSQIMLEEANELDNADWGNAENPPVFYQKDAPKGLKRLLKFARKSKGDGNSSGWSSPSVFSEGDDETDDCKAGSHRSMDSRLKKGSYHTKSTGQLKSLLSEGLERKDSSRDQVNDILNTIRRSSYQMGEGHDSVGISSTRSSRSFFSLSAFRGSK